MPNLWVAPLILAVSLGAQPTFPPAAPEKVSVPDEGIDLPMMDAGGRPVVELQLNGQGPYRFILDTGAESSTIDGDLIGELKLSSDSGGTVRISRADMGGASLTGFAVVSMPISAMFSGDGAPRGVLSALSFPGYLLVLDYPGKRIRLRKGELGAPDSRTVFQWAQNRVWPGVPVRVAGREIEVDLDSGSPLGLVVPTKYLKELPLLSKAKQIGIARTHSGEFPISTAQVKGAIELGQYKLDTTEVRFSDVRPGDQPPNGNLGYEILRGFKVTLDSKSRRVLLEQTAASN